MSDLPPPPTDPSGWIPSPRPTPPRRPGMVTATGTALIVIGALVVAGGFVILNDRGALALPGLSGREVATTAAIMTFVFGGLHILAGWLVLRLRPAGRILGIVIAVIGGLGGLAQLRQSGSSALLSLALYAFVLYGLIAFGFVFRAPPPPAR